MEEARRKTYKQVHQAVMDKLEDDGWSIKRGLKVPHATSPDRRTRLYFKAQAIYMDDDGPRFSLGSALSLTQGADLRKMSVDRIISLID